MGIDWENILDAEGEDLQYAYDDLCGDPDDDSYTSVCCRIDPCGDTGIPDTYDEFDEFDEYDFEDETVERNTADDTADAPLCRDGASAARPPQPLCSTAEDDELPFG